jgi:preprotein translocase subunit SecA
MILQLISKVFGTANNRKIQKLKPIVKKINSLEPQMAALSDQQLSEKTTEFKARLGKGETLDQILPEAFAVVRETSKRILGQRHYDVQLMGGIVLHQGKISEMKTGEGKTLTATLPLYLNALSGKGAHLVTVNEYLAGRDAEWMAPLYNHLGLSVATLKNSMDDNERKEAYNADILYATNSELGFDYLRDNMKFRLSDYVQRDLNYAIVDEVDSILIDEARTPLIISGASADSSKLYIKADKIIKQLQKNIDFEVDEKTRQAQLTEAGNDKVEAAWGVKNLYNAENLDLLHHTNQALRANALFHKDVEYVVRDGEVLIVDEFTGRILGGRRYSDGLHQAIEAKEGVKIEQETQTLASITLQNFFRLYKKLAGMTGTALTEAEEFYNIYKLDVVSIPTNLPMIRKDKPDLIFLDKESKYKAIVEDVKERYKIGQPVLIGTISVENSELLSSILKSHGIKHEVLNAKQHAREADIVAHAGEKGKITIATNMAGRGTDIKLNPDSKQAGGLYILGTERHESRRIDNQLRGRSGRQGDVGESRFYISLDDDLIRIFAGEGAKKRMASSGMKPGEVLESRLLSKMIENSQEKVEKYNFELRKNVLEYDDVSNQHRLVIYKFRRAILENSHESHELINDMICDVVSIVIGKICTERELKPEQIDQVFHLLSAITTIPEAEIKTAGIKHDNVEIFKTELEVYLIKKYNQFRSQNKEQHQEVERWLILEAIDKGWKQHMLNIDNLKEGISLRSWGQKNPLVEYKRESFAMFEEMLNFIKWEIVYHIFHLNAERFNRAELIKKREAELEQININLPEDKVEKKPKGKK